MVQSLTDYPDGSQHPSVPALAPLKPDLASGSSRGVFIQGTKDSGQRPFSLLNEYYLLLKVDDHARDDNGMTNTMPSSLHKLEKCYHTLTASRPPLMGDHSQML